MRLASLLKTKTAKWIHEEGERPQKSGFYWIYDEYYHGVTIGYFDSTYDNGRGQWEVWHEKPNSVYRQTDIFVTYWKDFEEPGTPV